MKTIILLSIFVCLLATTISADKDQLKHIKSVSGQHEGNHHHKRHSKHEITSEVTGNIEAKEHLIDPKSKHGAAIPESNQHATAGAALKPTNVKENRKHGRHGKNKKTGNSPIVAGGSDKTAEHGKSRKHHHSKPRSNNKHQNDGQRSHGGKQGRKHGGRGKPSQ